MTASRSLLPTTGLLLAVALFASPSEAFQPTPREQSKTRSSKRSPPARKELTLSPEVRARLSRATVKRKPVRYVPLTKKEVRAQIPADKRPVRTSKRGKVKRVSSTEVTNELNAIERKLSSQGYTLRDNRTVSYREHRPDRAKLDKQVRRVRDVAQTKPKRAPMTSDQLRTKVRRSAKPPARRSVGAGGAVNGFWGPQSPGPSAATDFDWTPSVGEAEIGSAFLDTRASFSGSIGGADPGLHGNIVVRAGGYVLNQRVEAVRFDATMSASLDGTYEADITATLVDGWEYPLYNKKGKQSFFASDALNLFDYDQKFHTKLLIVGYPVDIDLIISPSIEVAFDVEVSDGSVYGSLRPKIRVEATLEAYIDALLAKAGAGGSAVLLSASPELSGAAFVGEDNGQTSVHAYLSGWVKFHFLEGRVYAFLELGWWPFSTRFEWELWDYDGWAYEYPLFRWDSSNEP